MTIAATNLLRFLGATAAIIAMAVGLNFMVDPLQLFRPARLFAAMYSPDTRMQNAGLIQSQQFDTVFMGTSLAIHFRQSDIDRILGGRSLKLSMTGSNSREQSFVLAAAMARHPRRVIWQMDDWIFRDAPEIDKNIYLPADLYRRNAKGIASYLFSGAMARESSWILARSIPPLEPLDREAHHRRNVQVPDIPRRRHQYASARFRRAQDFTMRRRRPPTSSASRIPHAAPTSLKDYDYDAMVKTFESDAIGLIEKNPDVKFDIYFPPYSILQFVAMRDASPATLKIVYDFTAYASLRLTQLPNVTLHDFRAVKQITHDLGNYGDVIHHSPAVDLKVLSWLAQRKYVVDKSAPTASLEQLKAQVDAYRVERP